MSSSIPWRLREQARKDSAENEARRRATEKSEINFPSLSGTEWGSAPTIGAASPKKWTGMSAAPAAEIPRTTAVAARSSSYIPPTVVSRANIARAISEYKYYGDSQSSSHDAADEDKRPDDEEWVEVRGKHTPHKRTSADSFKFKDYEYNHYLDDLDDTGVEDSRNS
jgi:hypothetical protein